MTLLGLNPRRLRRPVATVPVVVAFVIAATVCIPSAGATPAPQSEPPALDARTITATLHNGSRRTPEFDVRGDRALFTWTGRVDREVLLVVRGRDVRTRGFDASLPSRTRVNSALPRNSGTVVVRLENGRGDVSVIEQPSARNGFQAVVRVRDPRGGADTYRLTAFWDDRFGADDRRGEWGRGDRGGRRGRRDGNTGALNWSGRVDDVVEVHISGRRVDAFTRSGIRVADVSSNIRGNGMPNRAVNITIDQHAGRGTMAIVQQPAPYNGYTAIIRIIDARSGASFYDFSAYWE